MSIRVKTALVIMSIVFVITTAYFFLSLSFTRQNLLKTIEQELFLTIAIVDDLIATKVVLIESDVDSVAERLLHTGSIEEMNELMKSLMDGFPDFISLTVFDHESIVASCGEPVSYSLFHYEEQYIQMAFSGETVFSTTHYSSITGAFIMYIFVPMGQNFVLCASIPGMFFTDLLSKYRLWRTGNIFMVDETGIFIAHYRRELVRGRYNFINEGEKDPTLQPRGDFFREMISNESGSGTYSLDGVERLCIYKHITSSRTGWRVAVATPLNESPLLALRNDLLFSALCFLVVGIIISILVSGLVSRPFYKIEEQNRNLEELNEKAMAASEAKSTFLARMSHEMRTPLNAVIGLSDLTLGSGDLDEETSSNLEKISNAGSTLLNTVNDILDISKIEAGKFELIPVEYDTPSLLNDTITQNIMRIGEKPIQFIQNIDEKLPARLYGDDLRIKQILNNLLSNAFKYTREGTVELSVNSLREGDTVWLNASVRDTGMGIKDEDLGSLFGNFVQVDTKSHRKIEGTGLGLSITKKMAEMMDGSINVESEYGKGSVFTVRLRQQFVNDMVIGSEVVNNLKSFKYSDKKRHKNSRMVRVNMPYARVLVVDDVPTNLDVARGMMKPYGMQIDCLTSGQEAIDAIRAEKVKYRAVFMDQMMPGMDGLEATRIIREEIGTDYAKTVPIIALTANAIVGNEEMFLGKGFQAFISKPIEINRLDSVLREWVRDKEQEQAPGQTNEEAADTKSGIDRKTFNEIVPWVDFEKGVERFGGDEGTFLQILRSYVVNTPALLETARGVNKENLANYAVTVHGIKGSSRGICAETVGAKAEALEKAAKEGNFSFVTANNTELMEAAGKLVDDLKGLFEKIAPERAKPVKDKFDAEVLSRLLTACDVYDMEGVDKAMAEIESFEYENDDGLGAWLRENVDQMNFTEIKEKLSALAG